MLPPVNNAALYYMAEPEVVVDDHDDVANAIDDVADVNFADDASDDDGDFRFRHVVESSVVYRGEN